MDKQPLEEGNSKRCRKPNDGYSTPDSTGLDQGRTLRSSSLKKNTPGFTTRSMSSLKKNTTKAKSSLRGSLTKGKDSTPRLPAKGKSVTPVVKGKNIVSPTKATPGSKDNNPRPSPHGKNENQMSSVQALISSPRVTTCSMVGTLTPNDTNITHRPSPLRKDGAQGSPTLGVGIAPSVTALMGSAPNTTETQNSPSISTQRNCSLQGSPALVESSSPRMTTRSMPVTSLPAATGEIGVSIPSPQRNGVTQSPATKSKNGTQTVTTQDVDITKRHLAIQGDSSAPSTYSASKISVQDETGILTRSRRDSSKPSILPLSSILSSPDRVVQDTATPSVKGEDSIPRRTTRSKGGVVTPTNQIEDRARQKHSSEAPCLEEKRDSLEKNTVDDPCLADKCVSRIPSSSEIVAPVASLTGEVGGSVASASNVVLSSLSVCPNGFDTSLTQYPAHISGSVISCPVEADAAVPPRPSEVCPGDIGVPQDSCLRAVDGSRLNKNKADNSKATVPSEKDARHTLGKHGTITTLGKDATSVSPEQNDGGVLPVTSSNQLIVVDDTSQNAPCDKETAVGSSHCTFEVQTSFQSGSTIDAPSVVIFNTTVETFLEKLVEAGSYQRFAKCYERFYKFQPEMTRSIYDQFIAQLKTSFKDEIQEIKEEGNLEALLDSLDKIKDEAKSRVEPAWRPSGIPEKDLQSTLVPYYLQQKEYMRQVLKEKESENAKLAESVLAGRKRIAELQQQIQKRKESWQAMGKAKTELLMSLQELKSECLKWGH